MEPCFTCEETTDNCLSCLTGFYFHENQCVDECPSGYKVDEAQTCYRASEPVLPFITMVGPVVFLLIVSISSACKSRTKPITAFIALQSAWMTGFYVYQLVYLVRDGHSDSPLIIVLALFCNYCINCFFYEYMKNEILRGKD